MEDGHFCLVTPRGLIRRALVLFSKQRLLNLNLQMYILSERIKARHLAFTVLAGEISPFK